MFCGVALSVTAVPVMGRMIMDCGLARLPAASISMAAATVTDVVGWLLLAMIVPLANGAANWSALALQVAMLIAYAGMSWWVLRPMLHRLIRRTSAGAQHHSASVIALVYLLLSSFATTSLGCHMAFGALLAGVVLRGQADVEREWSHYVDGFMQLVLIPVFFAYAGIHAQLGSLGAPNFWGWCAVFCVAGCAGKFGGAYAGARLSGLGADDARIVGALMNTRGLMELVVLAIGLQMHLLPTSVYTMLLLMALFTTGMTMPLLRHWTPTLRTKKRPPTVRAAASP
jgi:Kef-type K+ transport system membrane component KefB